MHENNIIIDSINKSLEKKASLRLIPGHKHKKNLPGKEAITTWSGMVPKVFDLQVLYRKLASQQCLYLLMLHPEPLVYLL